MARLLLALACFSLAACGATRQMVVAPEALAAKEAAKVLREGGNAVDAAVCAGFVLAVTHPEAGNLGGGGFFLLHLPDQDVVIDFRETAPSYLFCRVRWLAFIGMWQPKQLVAQLVWQIWQSKASFEWASFFLQSSELVGSFATPKVVPSRCSVLA